ncbi:MAG: hypothetical protein V4712_17740 [Pseudomonadota bacterium]
MTKKAEKPEDDQTAETARLAQEAADAETARLAQEAALPALGPFPSGELAAGHGACRAGWAPGYMLLAVEAGGRSGARRKLVTTGSRSGLIDWKPQHLADELLAQDWFVMPQGELIP